MKTPDQIARETAVNIHYENPNVDYARLINITAKHIEAALTAATADQEKLDWESDKAALEREINEYKQFHRNIDAARKEGQT